MGVEGCMKQIDIALSRAFDKQPPLGSAKWKAFIQYLAGDPILYLYHYHHRVLVYDIYGEKILSEWWEKPADKRGLDSAKLWLEDRERRYGR